MRPAHPLIYIEMCDVDEADHNSAVGSITHISYGQLLKAGLQYGPPNPSSAPFRFRIYCLNKILFKTKYTDSHL